MVQEHHFTPSAQVKTRVFTAWEDAYAFFLKKLAKDPQAVYHSTGKGTVEVLWSEGR